MAEVIVMSVFFLLLMVLQYREQRAILIPIAQPKYRKLLFIGLAVIIVSVFWPEKIADQLKLLIFALLIASCGLLKEGLGKDKLIKIGVLDASYDTFQSVSVEAIKADRTFVTLYKGKKNNMTSFFINESSENILRFFTQYGQIKIQK